MVSQVVIHLRGTVTILWNCGSPPCTFHIDHWWSGRRLSSCDRLWGRKIHMLVGIFKVMGNCRPHSIQYPLQLWSQLVNKHLRRPHWRYWAICGCNLSVCHCKFLFWFPAWYGQCTWNAMWTSIWSRASKSTWSVHAKIMDNSVCCLLVPVAAVCIRYSSTETAWTAKGYRRTCWEIYYSCYPSNVLVSHSISLPRSSCRHKARLEFWRGLVL